MIYDFASSYLAIVVNMLTYYEQLLFCSHNLSILWIHLECVISFVVANKGEVCTKNSGPKGKGTTDFSEKDQPL